MAKAPYEPTPEEIVEWCAKIQSEWSEHDRKSRAAGIWLREFGPKRGDNKKCHDGNSKTLSDLGINGQQSSRWQKLVRIRAERRIGELMKAQKDAGLLNKGSKAGRLPKNGGSRENPPLVDNKVTLAEVGIDKSLADRARKYAAVPEAEWEHILTTQAGRGMMLGIKAERQYE